LMGEGRLHPALNNNTHPIATTSLYDQADYSNSTCCNRRQEAKEEGP
jgi:hypothetical protein